MRDLQSSHFKEMKELGYSDEEIEKDFEQVLKDLGLFHKWLEEKAEAKKIKEEMPKDVPW